MTEGERREGTGETKKNVEDDLDEAAGSEDRPSKDEDDAGGSGGTKDNVRDDQDKTQRR